MTVFSLDGTEFADTGEPIQIENDGKSVCPDCGKRLTVTQAGTLRAHKCENGSTRNVTSTRSKKNSTKAKRSNTAPPSVFKVGSAAIASGVEWGSSRVLASYIPCDPNLIPKEVVEISDAEEMIYPLIKLAWPQIPAKAQGVITAICDQEDLIVCLLAWWSYFSILRKFAEQAHQAILKAQKEQQTNSTDAQVISLRKDTTNGIQEQATGQQFGAVSFAGVQPFAPSE